MPRLTLPSLIEAVKRELTDDRKRALRIAGGSSPTARESRSSTSQRSGIWMGCQPDFHRAHVRGNLGAMKKKDWSLVSEVDSWALAVEACGISTSITSLSAAQAGPAWAMGARVGWRRAREQKIRPL